MPDVIEKSYKSVNPDVHWMNFGNVMQNEAESFKDFLVRICSLVGDCESKCPACKTDISSINIEDQFICGFTRQSTWTSLQRLLS